MTADTLRVVFGLVAVAVTSWAPFIALAWLGSLRGEARRRALAGDL
mgnify:FL=1